MNADLHIHSTHSDGSFTVEEIIATAKALKLDAVSVTDHDTTAGTAEALALGRAAGLRVIPGVELSAFDFRRRKKAHLLGYGYRSGAPAINALCAPLLKARHENSLRQVDLLAASGFDVTREEAQAVAGDGRVIYKQHIMTVLVNKGVTDAVYSTLYRALFGHGGLCEGDIAYLDVFEALEAVLADGGVAVLAHPGQLDSWPLVEELVARGLGGIEYYHESHDAADYRLADALAKKYPRLVLTGGSDFHGAFGAGRHGIGDFRAPASFAGFSSPYPNELSAAAAGVVREAGALLRRAALRPPRAQAKNGDCHDVVSAGDLAAEDFLARRLTALLPGSAVVSEETDGGASPARGNVWIVDPIDGTVNFLLSGTGYAVSVALWENGRPRFGFVYDVSADELFFGVAGGGAFCNGERLERPSRARALSEAVVDFSLHTLARLKTDRGADLEDLAPLVRGHRSCGCASLALCRIAQGKLDAYCAARLRVWDYAAAAVVLEEAGGRFAVAPDAAGDPRGPRRFVAAGSRELLAALAPFMFPERIGEERTAGQLSFASRART
jgi:fructose-1,6-bisphosphatase/inositol monophosphatase family enzyme/predicted metal-dependent phosphoesterase TrpH